MTTKWSSRCPLLLLKRPYRAAAWSGPAAGDRDTATTTTRPFGVEGQWAKLDDPGACYLGSRCSGRPGQGDALVRATGPLPRVGVAGSVVVQ